MSDVRAPLDVLPVGYRLDDFRIVEVLGKGGFGITYKAIDERLERQVAIKEYLPRDFAFRSEGSAVLPRGDAEKPTFSGDSRASSTRRARSHCSATRTSSRCCDTWRRTAPPIW